MQQRLGKATKLITDDNYFADKIQESPDQLRKKEFDYSIKLANAKPT